MDSSDNVIVQAAEVAAEIEALGIQAAEGPVDVDAVLEELGEYWDPYQGQPTQPLGTGWMPAIEGMLTSFTGAVGAGLAYSEHARLNRQYSDELPTVAAWRPESRNPETNVPTPEMPFHRIAPHPADAAGSGTSRSFTHMSTGINSADIPNKRQRMSTPSQGTKRASHVEITTDATSSRKKAKTSLKINKNVKTVASQTIATSQSYYDCQLLMNAGEKRLTKLNVKLGKQLYPDVITPFLQQMNQNATIRMQFAGRCITDANSIRHNHVQMFRHRLSTGATFNQGHTTVPADPSATPPIPAQNYNPYPPAFRKNFLLPFNSKKFYVNGSSNATTPSGAYLDVGKTPFSDIATNETYWSPYNLADLEDCSWSLNKIKLYPSQWGYPYKATDTVAAPVSTPILGLIKDTQPFQENLHFRSSLMAFNNSLQAVIPDGTIPPAVTGPRPARYKYKANIHTGNVSYDFMNKGTGGAKVEVLVYRVKRNQVLDFDVSSQTTSQSYVNDVISEPIMQGYLDTCLAKQGTDNLGGRAPLSTDVKDNAQFPFLPNLKATKQGALPFTEVSRQTFAMPSGSRRELTVTFPGIFYDPRGQPMVNPDGDPLDSVGHSNYHPSIFDEYSYAIMISVCGVPSTNEMHANLSGVTAVAYNIGDVISRADVQFYGTYTENIGAACYKVDKKAIMYSAGSLVDTVVTGSLPTDSVVTEHPVSILPQGAGARQPTIGTGYTGINLTAEFNSAA